MATGKTKERAPAAPSRTPAVGPAAPAGPIRQTPRAGLLDGGGEGGGAAQRARAATAAQRGPGNAWSGGPSGPVELKGRKRLDRASPVAALVPVGQRAPVDVRFGEIAHGSIGVHRAGEDDFRFNPTPLHLTHPLFSRTTSDLAPTLVLSSQGRQIDGHLGIAGENKAPDALVRYLSRAPELIGLAGFDLPGGFTIENQVTDGSLRLGLKGVRVVVGSAFSGSVDLEAVDETVTFHGQIDIKAAGLAGGSLELARSPEGVVTGHAVIDIQATKNVNGHLDVVWDGVAVTGEGKIGYQGEKFSGEITMHLMELEKAKQLKAERKAEQTEKSADRKEGKKGARIPYAVFGEGDLTFAFNEWLHGTAHAAVDHERHLTVIGEITPQKEVELFAQKSYEKHLFDVEARASYGLPVVGNIFIFGGVGMSAFAMLGPAKFYNIVIKGTYSTDPEVKQDFGIKGSLNVSAGAGLKLRAYGGAGLEILSHDIKAGAGIDGIAGIKGYVEATPEVGYREEGAPGEDQKGRWFVHGDLELAAQSFLGLSGDLFVEVDAPWWSPVPDKRWTWPLGSKEWPLGNSFGFIASLDYVFGSTTWPTLTFKPAQFQPDKFMSDLYADKTQPKAAERAAESSVWKERNTKTTEPSAPKPGVSPTSKKPPGKESVRAPAAQAKAGAGPADPHARTAEGKTVKELQKEAAAKGKKPVDAAGARSEKSGSAHDEKVRGGLKALQAVVARYTETGATKDQLENAVKSVRRKFFTSLNVVDGGSTWDFEYTASPTQRWKEAIRKLRAMKLEDRVGSYSRLSRLRVGEPVERHHVPQKAVMLDYQRYREKVKETGQGGADYTEGKGLAVMLPDFVHAGLDSTDRHRDDSDLQSRKPMDLLNEEVKDVKRAAGKADADEAREIRKAIGEMESLNKARFNWFFSDKRPKYNFVRRSLGDA